MARRSYRFARTPGWLIGHLVVLVAIAVMVSLGFWQLRRLDDRRAANERIEQRSLHGPAAVGDLAREPIETVEFRRVEARGTFDAGREVLVGYRTSRGLPGYHVVTPLVLAGETAQVVLVNRGFVPLALAEQWPAANAAPPAGEVDVVGILRRSAHAKTRSISVEPGEVPTLNAVDVDAIAAYAGYPPGQVLPVQVELQQPVPRGFPEPLPELDLGEGPHQSYALQWFAFSVIAAGGWLLLLRRRAVPTAPPGQPDAPPPSASDGPAIAADSSAAAR